MSKRKLNCQARNYFLPFILGNEKKSAALASKVYKKSRIRCFIINSKRSCRNLFSPAYFVLLSQTDDDRLLCEQLIDLAKQYPSSLPILVPSDEEYKEMIEQNRELLERCFLIREAEDLLSRPPLANIN